MCMPTSSAVTREIRCRRATVSAVFDNTLLIQLFQHQHSNPRIIAGNDPLHPGFVPVPVVDHGAKTRAPIVPGESAGAGRSQALRQVVISK